MTPVAVLTGPPGAGKTTVGQSLADLLGVDFRDSDADVERVAGMSVAEVFLDVGEPAFRAMEKAVVAAALTGHDGVLALGGGSVLDPETRASIVGSGSPVVLLEVGVAAAAVRVGFNRDRPLLLGNPRQQWTRLLAARMPVYLEVCTHRVSTDDRTPDEVAAEVAGLLRPVASGGGTHE